MSTPSPEYGGRTLTRIDSRSFPKGGFQVNLYYAPGRLLSRTMPTIRDDTTVSASDETVNWLERQYKAVDGMDMDGFLSFMPDEA